ncbi:MAG: T9SS type B sorting domain-containing protein [Microscillaceae bacterium]|nr:T9SS type B sorting domain-containing protein [Microscillaceae bacterium]
MAQFSNESSTCSGSLNYVWDFGDGQAPTAENFVENPVYVYQTPGTYTVTLTATIVSNDANNGFATTRQLSISVTQVPPTPTLGAFPAEFCANAAPLSLSASPSGGQFEVEDASGTITSLSTVLEPSLFSPGDYTLRYRYTDPNNSACLGIASEEFEILPLPVLSFSQLNLAYCQSEASFPLLALPAGGTFEIDNVPSTTLNPGALSPGAHEVRYSYTHPATGCTNTISQTVQINALPNPTFSNLRDQYCVSGAAFALEAQPAGGTFTLNNQPATQFDPSQLGLGQYEISYTYTDPTTNCTNTVAKNVSVVNAPEITFQNIEERYCEGDSPVQLSATPSGGIFTLNNEPTPISVVDPFALPPGNYRLFYTYSDPVDGSCQNQASFDFIIYAAIETRLINAEPSYCANDNQLVTPALEVRYADGSIEILPLPEAHFVPSEVVSGVFNFIRNNIVDPVSQCFTSVAGSFFITPVPETTIVGLEASYCQQGLVVPLVGQPAGGIFTINGVETSVLNPASYAVGQVLNISYLYTIQNCESEVSQSVLITPNDNFSSEQYTLDICPEEFTGYLLRAVPDVGLGVNPDWTYDWTLNSQAIPEPGALIRIQDKSQEGTYAVLVRDGSSCPVYYNTFFVTLSCAPQFQVPEAFSPNGDGLNDKLQFFGKDLARLRFQVFNRWGELVFESRRAQDWWDGNYRGNAAPAGVYFWQVSYENLLEPGQIEKKQGKLMLLR